MFDEQREAKQSTYRLGLSAGIFNYKAKYILVSNTFAKHPEINLILEDIDRKSWLNALTTGQVDAMLIYEIIDQSDDAPPSAFSRLSGLRFTFLKEQLPQIVFPKSHPMASRDSVSMEELAQETFLFNHDLNKVGEQSRDALVCGFLRSCSNAGFTPIIVSQNKTGADFANIRDISIETNGWIYPTFQLKSWCRTKDVTFVPLRGACNKAHFYFVTLERKATAMDKKISECLHALCNMD